MTEGIGIRDAVSDDRERIRAVVESSMTSSYAMSPQDIETVLEAEYSERALGERLDDGDHLVRVAEIDDVVVGVVEAAIDGPEGTIRGLHVDPERRGRSAGTQLFEHVGSELRDRDVDSVRAVALAAATEGGEFYQRFGFDDVDERTDEIGGRPTVEYVHESDREPEETTADEDRPETVTATDGRKVFLGDEGISGSDGLFVRTYADAEYDEEFGYFCSNCESTDVTMSSADRLRCGNCGNTHTPSEEYDGAYL